MDAEKQQSYWGQWELLQLLGINLALRMSKAFRNVLTF